MKINGKLEWTDYRDAQYLHMRPGIWFQIMLYILIVIVAFGFVIDMALLAFNWGLWGVWVCSWPILIFGGLLLLQMYVLHPWNTHKIYGQQKEMSAPFEYEITQEGLLSINQYGQVNRPWSVFRKWKENKRLLLIYTSDIQMEVIPKRFCTTEQLNFIRGYLAQNRVLDANRSDRGFFVSIAFFLFGAVIVGVSLYLKLNNSMP